MIQTYLVEHCKAVLSKSINGQPSIIEDKTLILVMSQAVLVKINQFKTDINFSKACSSFVYHSCLILRLRLLPAKTSNIRLMEHRLHFRGKKTFQNSTEKDKISILCFSVYEEMLLI